MTNRREGCCRACRCWGSKIYEEQQDRERRSTPWPCPTPTFRR
jgi:hypothetical protein